MSHDDAKSTLSGNGKGLLASRMDPTLMATLEDVDPGMVRLIQSEKDRQNRKLILIPSESMTPWPVRSVIGSAFVSPDAEGCPPARMLSEDEHKLQELALHLSLSRGYGDRRFCKGTEFAHFVEALAQRRCAACFANARKGANEIFVNVQPLSGAVANLAVYEAFLKPGDTILAMELTCGGHPSRGSHLRVSGKNHQVVCYGVHPNTGRLDYNIIDELARKHKPKLVLAGYASYPWAPDWERFRNIADRCGAKLMADVGHPAGLIIGGVYPSPVGYADVVTLTTHQTLCGPHGACILTFGEADAERVDAAVFPGLQGGPHVANIAAIAVTFRIAQTEPFVQLQRNIVENARHLAEALVRQGVPLGYGGTDTHLLVVDLCRFNRGGEAPLRGEPAARILDQAGLVVDKNPLPGDPSPSQASAIRLGTPWLTQRGFGRGEMEQIASWLTRVIRAIVPFRYVGRTGDLPRGKIPFDVLTETKREIQNFLEKIPPCRQRVLDPAQSGLPENKDRAAVEGSAMPTASPRRSHTARRAPESRLSFWELNHFRFLRVQGQRASAFMQQVATRDAAGLAPGQCQETLVLDEKGFLIDDILVLREEELPTGEERFLLAVHQECSEVLLAWLEGLSDGYLQFDLEEPYGKVEGPVTFDLNPEPMDGSPLVIALCGPAESRKEIPVLGDLAGELPNGSFRGIQGKEGRGLLCHLEATFLWMGSELEGKGLIERMRADRWVGKGREEWERKRQENGLPDYRKPPLQDLKRDTGRPHGRDLLRSGHAKLFNWDVPYFVGQSRLKDCYPVDTLPEFAYQERAKDGSVTGGKGKTTRLYPFHKSRKAHFISFAGWDMPGWFSQVTEEHLAVRRCAGLFDTTHMGVLEIRGPRAEEFLELINTNSARGFPDGMSYYGFCLDIHGEVLDDLIVYPRQRDRFMLVVNASNHNKILAWLEAVNRAEVAIDQDRRCLKRLRSVEIRNLSDLDASGEEARVDIALQGPLSKTILLGILDAGWPRESLASLRKGAFFEAPVLGSLALISRTGYTGEWMGFEIFVHPEKSGEVWSALLEKGESAGLKPAGLAARDSLRIEAGLPLYGHELAGPERIRPVEAGLGAYVKLHKTFFIGRTPTLESVRTPKMEICRFRMEERGVRVPRQGDPVVNRKGRVIGKVTSCTTGTDGHLLGLAYVERGQVRPGSWLGLFPLPQKPAAEKADRAQLTLGDKVLLAEQARVLERFPSSAERSAWK